ncbi:hypothetical protein [Okeania sp. SIO1I7]|uniref:hypothetical protein n=1 Tax=Okeania sp. SIO1I7 TaxID=2607772 RepID=UPI0013FA6EFE|nr:hypothetical protein [Okeania sp. SIO1I7]NET25130.1 hypothetical protein [Okeania sp. SIO1I7]
MLISEIIDLPYEASFYFWRSEGKNIKKLLDISHSILKDEKNNKGLLNIEYYYALYFLQEGCYKKARRHLETFVKNIDNSNPIFQIAAVHYGKSLFYLKEYQQSLDIWNNVKQEINNTILPRDILDYHNASIVWREYLVNSSGLLGISESKIDYEYLLDNAAKVGSDQMKSVWFASGYSKYLNNDFESCLNYVCILKNELKNNFRQPMFMAAALLLEARTLMELGRNNKKQGLVIIESLNRLNLNWNSQLFMNHISKRDYIAQFKHIQTGNTYKDIVSESKEYMKNNHDFLYISNHLRG